LVQRDLLSNMFKKFTASDISGQTVLKSSVQRSIRANILTQWTIDPETLELVWPKKEPLMHVKCRDHISIYTVHGEPLLLQHFDGPFYPSLRLLHRYPNLLPRVQIDRGAIRFLLSGVNMMCPGMTSKGGWLPPSESAIAAEKPVAIYAEGKLHAAGLGLTKMDTEQMKKVNKDVGVELITHVGDDLWNMKKIGS